MVLQAKEAYHDGELMASGRKFQSMKEAVKALVPIVEYIASGACGPGQAGVCVSACVIVVAACWMMCLQVVRTLYASIAYSTNDLTLLKSAAEYFSGSGQYEHSWSIWQRVHYSQLKSESSPVAFPGGYIFNATPSSLQSHAVACFGLSRLEQGQFLLTKVS